VKRMREVSPRKDPEKEHFVSGPICPKDDTHGKTEPKREEGYGGGTLWYCSMCCRTWVYDD